MTTASPAAPDKPDQLRPHASRFLPRRNLITTRANAPVAPARCDYRCDGTTRGACTDQRRRCRTRRQRRRPATERRQQLGLPQCNASDSGGLGSRHDGQPEPELGDALAGTDRCGVLRLHLHLRCSARAARHRGLGRSRLRSSVSQQFADTVRSRTVRTSSTSSATPRGGGPDGVPARL